MDDDRVALLGETPSTRRPSLTRDVSRAFVIAVALIAGLVGFAVSREEGVGPNKSALGRSWKSSDDLARWAHVAMRAKERGRVFTPAAAHRVVVMAMSSGDNAAQANEWAASLKDVGLTKFMIGCGDEKCLRPLQALGAPVFDARESTGGFMMDGGSTDDAARWAGLAAAESLLDLGYTVMLTQPTVRFRRNPMEVVADSISRHDSTHGAVFAMRGATSMNVTQAELGAWTDGTSLASLRDDFVIFTPGSQPLIRSVLSCFNSSLPEDVASLGQSEDELSTPAETEFNYKSNAAYVLNHVLSKDGGLRWKSPNGKPAAAAPFKTKPREIAVDAALLGADGSVPGVTTELSGVASIGDHPITVVLLDTVVARAHCNDADADHMRQTYVVGCDLDDASLAGRRVEIDHQCVVLKALEASGEGFGRGPAHLFGAFEHLKGADSPIADSRGFLGALDACRL
jgi:hypothetical protein